MAAGQDDIDAVVDMASRVYDNAELDDLLGDIDLEHVRSLLSRMLSSDDAAVIIARKDGQAVGWVGLFMVPAIWHPKSTMVHELAWWVEPEERGNGVGSALLGAATDWAKKKGASALNMVALKGAPETARTYVNGGFRLLESTYTKRL
jgi:GNAT superfamily N-acetyltransferase